MTGASIYKSGNNVYINLNVYIHAGNGEAPLTADEITNVENSILSGWNGATSDPMGYYNNANYSVSTTLNNLTSSTPGAIDIAVYRGAIPADADPQIQNLRGNSDMAALFSGHSFNDPSRANF